MRNCRQARALFDAYWDDDASQAEREWLESHLSACSPCRQSYDEMARVLETLASMPHEEASADFVERTVARARRAAAEPDRVRAGAPRWVGVAAAASVALVLATVVAPWFMAMRSSGPDGTLASRTPREPQLVRTVGAASPSLPVATAPSGDGQVMAVVDSLIDHAADVEFILDPVHVSRGRAAVAPHTAPAQGQQAVITF